MRILIVGANGTLGKRISEELSKRNEIIKAGRNSGEVRVDIESRESIENMFKQVKNIDACVLTAGSAHFGSLQSMTEENVYTGIKSKLMGQINTVLIGQNYINVNGSFTLTSGILGDDPVKFSSAFSLVNGGLNSFVIAAARELTKGIRINIVSPGLVEDSAEQLGEFYPGHIPVEMKKVVSAYVKSVEGCGTGEIIRVY